MIFIRKVVMGTALTLAFSGGLTSQALAVTPSYTITDIGLGGTYGVANDINNNGQVVGGSYTSRNLYYHAFQYNNGAMTDLGSLVANNSVGLSISNNGQVLGKAAGSYFTYSGGVATNLGALAGGKSYDLSGINNNGQLAGTVTLSPQSCNIDYCTPAITHAFSYTGGGMTDLGTLYGGAGSSIGNNINNMGQVVGESTSSANNSHAFLYSGGAMTDLGTLGGSYSTAYSINDNGQVVGFSDGPIGNGVTQAFLYSNGKMIGLGTLGSSFSLATDINNAGQVVGWFNTANTEHAFLYSGGSMVDLNSLISPSSGWTLYRAYAINDNGQVVGYGSTGGQTHAFLLTPTSAVPVPAAIWLMGSGLFGLAGIARKTKTS